MVTAFVHHRGGEAETIDTIDRLPELAREEGCFLWIDLEGPTEAELTGLGAAFNLDADAIEDCLSGEQHPRIDEFENHIFLVLYGMLADGNAKEFSPRKLATFCGSNFLITVHADVLRTVREVRDRYAKHAAQLLPKGIDFLLHVIVDGVADRYIDLVDAHEIRLEQLEGRSLDPGVDADILSDLSDLRQELLEIRRVAASQRALLTPVARGEYDYVSEAMEQRFSHVRDHFTKVVELIDVLRDRLNGVRDNYHTTITLRLNAVMKTLTLFATIMLPLTVITGIYGMNLPLWPPAERPQSFWIVLGVLVIVGGSLFTFFRRKKWI